jgi:hypothetical protein
LFKIGSTTIKRVACCTSVDPEQKPLDVSHIQPRPGDVAATISLDIKAFTIGARRLFEPATYLFAPYQARCSVGIALWHILQRHIAQYLARSGLWRPEKTARCTAQSGFMALKACCNRQRVFRGQCQRTKPSFRPFTSCSVPGSLARAHARPRATLQAAQVAAAG